MLDPHQSTVDRQVMVGRRDIDTAVVKRLAVTRMRRGKTAGACQNLGQHAAAARQVKHDQDGGAQIARQLSHDRTDGFHTTRRGADYDDVMRGHTDFQVLHHPYRGHPRPVIGVESEGLPRGLTRVT